ncbi:MAG: type II secretion system protein N [Betaproteobacteria bacterium]
MTWLSRRRLWTLAAIAFVIGAVEFLPAHLFEDRINRSLPPPWHISVTGTVWNGFGVLQAAQSVDAFTVPLTWTFEPAALLRARAAWKIVPTSPALSGSVSIGAGLDSVEFSDTALAMDAAALQQAIPIVALFAPWGNILVSTPPGAGLTLTYGNDLRLNGDAQLKAENLGLRPYGPQPLGSYQVMFTARETMIDYRIAQSSGALILDGGGSIQTAAPRQIAYSGFVTPSPTLPDSVLSPLKAMGQPAADGRVRIDWKARW